MKPLIVYYSKTGFTQRYALWLAQALQADLVSLEKLTSSQLKQRETIIFGSYVHAGRLNKLSSFLKQFVSSPSSRLYLFGVGASPVENEMVENLLLNHKKDFESFSIDTPNMFYFSGGINYEKMGKVDHFLMKMFAKMMKNKAKKSEFPLEWAEKLQNSYDVSDRTLLEPLIESVNKHR